MQKNRESDVALGLLGMFLLGQSLSYLGELGSLQMGLKERVEVRTIGRR